MDHAVIERYRALDAAFVARAGRGDRLTARFAALAGLSAPQDVETLIERSFETRDSLNRVLGLWRAPSKSMRLVFATALVASERSAEHFFEARRALRERRDQRGSRALSHGGACAALALIAAGGHPHQADQFYDILDAIAAPWWRREASREEIIAAALAAMGDLPDEARARLDRARQTLRDAHIPDSAVEAAAYEVAFFEPEAGDVAASWTALSIAVRGRSALKNGVGKTGLAILSAQGHGQEVADALVDAFDGLREIRPRISSQVSARIAQRLAQAQLGSRAPMSAASDLAAILAAQAAMIAAVTAATTSATVAATS